MTALSRLFASPGRFGLRRIGFAVLVLPVLTLVGGVPPYAEAQNKGNLFVRFSQDTLPIGRNAQGEDILCQGQTYKILAQGVLNNELQPRTEQIDKLYIAQSTTNSIEPQRITIRAHEPAAVFVYTAKNKGSDALSFEVYGVPPLPVPFGTRNPTVEVKECTYKVTFVYSWQMAVEGYSFAQFGLMEETRLEPQEDGTFKGSGSFVLSQFGVVPGCKSVNFSDVPMPTHVTGNLNQNTHELALEFPYDTTPLRFSVSCAEGSLGGSRDLDASQGGLTKASFPEAGGTKEFPTQGGGTPGKLTVIVNQELSEIAR